MQQYAFGKWGILWLHCLLFVGPVFAQGSNELANETSPYLLQHANNPVNWYPWGEKALSKAQEEGKMLLISVGYSACHWCHVMEEESFEDAEVAALMNAHFVCIKVDREERPDVDKLYMTAAQMSSGNAGWPLNAFALPDGRPFYGASYFEKEQWLRLLNYFVKLYAEERDKIVTQATGLSSGIKGYLNIPLNDEPSGFSVEDLDVSASRIMELADPSNGGLQGAPKFPMPVLWEYLLHYAEVEKSQEVEEHVIRTLDKLASSGVYDHLGGGFFRYSTDAQWKLPHFEKMLCDNAQLVSLYTHAWQKTRNPRYKEIVYQTLDFIAREMTAPEGGFYTSLDADSEGEEGKYYLWTRDELETLLSTDLEIFAFHFGCQPGDALENETFHLREVHEIAETATHFELNEDETRERLTYCIKLLHAAREKRQRPGLDDKQLTGWNALMLKAHATAYRAFGEAKFLDAAQRNVAFLEKYALEKSALYRSTVQGKTSIPGFLDDYALLIDAFIELYQASLDESWLNEAKKWQEVVNQQLYITETGMYRYAAVSALFAENVEVDDNALPSSNSVCAYNLLRLGHYFYDTAYLTRAKVMWQNMRQRAMENPASYANWNRLALMEYRELYEVALVGKEAARLRAELDQSFLPQVILYGSTGTSTLDLLEGKFVKGQNMLYVCRNRSCKMPVQSVADALRLLNE